MFNWPIGPVWLCSRLTLVKSASLLYVYTVMYKYTDMQPKAHKGRGAVSNPPGRFEAMTISTGDCEIDTHWNNLQRQDEVAPVSPETRVHRELTRKIVTRNNSPDVPFDFSINPYRGCEHGCIYCYARPSHAYMDLSPGLDFETQIFFKDHASDRLRETFDKKSYTSASITIGANTDPYQPLEGRLEITRSLLEVFLEYHHPVSLITKGSMVTRDLDILSELAALNLVSVMVSITTLDPTIKRTLEPRAASAAARLRAVEQLSNAGVPVGVLVAPIIPAITDNEMESILKASAAAGAAHASYILLRLPYEVSSLFRQWLQIHYPLRADHVMSLVRQSRGGRDNDPRFGKRMRGEGAFADLISRRFKLACNRFGLKSREKLVLDTTLFRRPTPQMDLLAV